jgi:hypothetical protein
MSDRQSILGMFQTQLNRIEDKLDAVIKGGCAKAEEHARAVEKTDDLARRVGILETARAESRGKWAVIGAIAGVLAGPLVTWIGRRLFP